MELNIKRLTEEEFSKFAKLIYDESGIYMKDSKITLLSNRLRKRLAALSLNEFSDYYNYLEKLTGEAKRRNMRSSWTSFQLMKHIFSGMKDILKL